jgi:hypothetical protein
VLNIYFNATGKFYADEADVIVNEEDKNVHYFLAQAPDVPRWRLSLDIPTGVVTDCYPGMSVEEAEAQLDIDLAAANAKES